MARGRGNPFGYGGRSLPTTRWTIVNNAGQDDKVERDKALSELCKMYWTPVYGFILAKGRPEQEAQDLTQGFFTTRLIEKNDVAAADPTRGRFRNWLLTAVSSYMKNDLEMRRAIKRNPGTEIISIDTAEVEGQCPIQVGDDVTPEFVFERRWAMVLLCRVLQKLEISYNKRGDDKLFQKLLPLLTPGRREAHRSIAKELDMQEQALTVALFRFRSRFQEYIRDEIAETVVHESEIEDELRYLYSCFESRPGGIEAPLPRRPRNS